MAARKTSRPPWSKPAPKSAKHTKLSSAKKSAAKARAKKAGRRYPNLVDNMAAASGKTGGRKATPKKKSAAKKSTAKKSTAKKTAKKSTAKKSTAKKTAKKSTAKKAATKSTAKKSKPKKDPRGGLTAAGRAAFRKKDGAHLKPGVMKAERDMSVEEMRRKGSWAARFYGRTKLPALVGDDGKPTRFALTAAAWGEPVPKTIAAARKIAEKGRRLLEKAKRAKV